MPRKHARPAARKRLEMLKERVAKGEKVRRLARPYLAEPHFGDDVLLAALSASVVGLSKHRLRFHYEN